MKQKIKSALEQGYKNLGVGDEAFERVAALGETFIKEESQIADFVRGAEGTLKLYQSKEDKIRTELNARIKALEGEKAELETKLAGETKPEEVKVEPKETPKQSPQEDMLKMISEAVAVAVQPLQDKIQAFESGQATKQARVDAEAKFMSNDWVKKYPTEAEFAWKYTVELDDATGKKMDAQALGDKALSYFGEFVSKKGGDISKPFQNEGEGKNEPDFSPFDRVVAAEKASKGEASQE